MASKLTACVFGMIAALAATSAASVNSFDTHTIHERRNTDSDPLWIKRSISERHHEVPVRIGLKQRNLDRAEDLLMDVSDPMSRNYGKYLTAEQVIDLFAPTEEATNKTRTWLEDAGITSRRINLSSNKQWLQFDATIAELEHLLHTTYFEFEHPATGSVTLGCDHYHIPAKISHHIDVIKPGVNIHVPKSPRLNPRSRVNIAKRNVAQSKRLKNIYKRNSKALHRSARGSDCDGGITPNCIFQMYKIPNRALKKQPNNSVSVYETDGELYSQQALNEFLKSFTKIPPGTSPEIKLIDGAPSPTILPKNSLGGEADLDLQVLYPLAYPDNIQLFQVNTYQGNKYLGLFNLFLDALDGSYCNYTAFGISGDTPGVDQPFPDPNKGGYKGKLQCGVYKPTKVISISYGYDERTYSTAYQRRQCNEFLKLGLQGTTILVSSGDYGVTNTGLCAGPNHTIFNPSNPGGCPYILSVGATRLPPGAKPGVDREKATNVFGSGGGFSNIFPPPKYQADAVKHYLKKYSPDYPYYETKYNSRPGQNEKHGIYNRAGRGIPDVSAIGQDVVGWAIGKEYGYGQGSPILQDGTSASAPIFAGLLSRINNHRLAAGKSSVGFINPTLYAHPEIFNDVVDGENNPPGTTYNGREGCGTPGFNCAPGWDPVTGLGTPNFKKMLEVFAKLP